MGSINKLAMINAPITDLNLIKKKKIENLSRWPRSVEEILKKQDGKMYYGNTKTFHIF